MWILFVLSFVPELKEYKVTEFNRYDSQKQCTINQAVLEATFEQGEKAICVNE